MDQLDFSFIILSFSSLFALLNPIGIAPIILSLTENYNLDEYKKLIRKSTFFACMILLIFAVMGKIIFSFYAITIHAFKIAGGILFLRIGLNMLEAKVSRTKSTPKEAEEAESNTDIALSPTFSISRFFICTIEPDVSTASPFILLNLEFEIVPLLKSKSIASDFASIKLHPSIKNLLLKPDVRSMNR